MVRLLRCLQEAGAAVVEEGSAPWHERLVRRMQAAGLRKAVITLVGWNLGGHDGAYPQRFPVEPALGGEAGLRKLAALNRADGARRVRSGARTRRRCAGA